MAGKIKGAASPPRGDRREIVRVTTAETQFFTIVSSAAWGVRFHWYGGRSHECTADKGPCANCQRSWPDKWRAYLHAIHSIGKNPCFLELTKDAMDQLECQTEDRENLRGTLVQIKKTKGGAKGRYIVTVLPRILEGETLPPEEDPLPVLRFLWRVKNRHCQDGQV